ncbi:hypothetical protein BJ170DRAFT_608716 [Xylariales sp. AK1849]|nr:hypothetical protein BJ170DRAFT_608716 [Xylariales sp. AK1849]
MNESYRTIEGVLAGVPHDCLDVFVSNSDRHTIDKYECEVRLLENFCKMAGRAATLPSIRRTQA